MATILVDQLEVCVDCAAISANGELGQGDAAADEAHAELMVAKLGEGLQGAAGLVLTCEEDCEGWFSWRACDGCGSALAGDRHPAAILV